jgi:uncharacterized cupredoxin-like copper-binding protein
VKKFLTVFLTAGLVLSACGGDDDDTATETPADEATETEAAETEAPATEEATEAPATEEATEAPATEQATEAPATEEAAATGTAVNLVEWAVEMPATLTAGPNSFSVTNGGSFPHKLDIFAGESYETLPLLENGAVDEATLPPVAATENIGPGESATLDADLPAGTYVFACNIAVGPNSHAAAGQVFTVTVG